MFEPTSRYFTLEAAPWTLPDGREVRYVCRRLIPPPPGEMDGIFAEHAVTEAERPDHIAARYLGDPELFWRLCDANNAMRPEELTGEIGRRIRVALIPF